MNRIQNRIDALAQLGDYMKSEDETWMRVKTGATRMNPWFTPEAVDMACNQIADGYLNAAQLDAWVSAYTLPERTVTLGIVMAGNIPLVGFHDFLCGFLSGHHLRIKLSSKDNVLLPHLATKLAELLPETGERVQFIEMLKGCDAYIATGSNNSSRYFEEYFEKYRHLIRRNRTSVAVLDGTETDEELQRLGIDVFSYYGLGCRNVTQVLVPRGYDFAHLLDAFNTYAGLTNQHKYKNNYDYHLALYLLNRVPYLTNESVLLVENALPFSAVSVLHYEYYDDRNLAVETLKKSEDIQCIVGRDLVPFGRSQFPGLADYADGMDTMAFCCSLG